MSQRILYILTPGTNISPFDVTLASDAGFDKVLPFTGVKPSGVIPMVQDSIFARPPMRFNDTGIFISGRDVHQAKDMLDQARNAMVGPFEVGVFADPNGAYTTSGSVVALVEKALQEKTGKGLKGRKVKVFGPGPVGLCTAVLASQQGAEAKLCQLTADDERRVAERFCDRYKVDVEWVSALTAEEKAAVAEDAEVLICTAKAGIRILDSNVLEVASNTLVLADTNAVPPSGISGLGAQDNGLIEVGYTHDVWGIGALAIGNLKYKTQIGLFEKMQTSEKAALIDFPDAYKFALSVLEKMSAKEEAA